MKRECLDWFLCFSLKHLDFIVQAYARFYNERRPHQSKGNRVLTSAGNTDPPPLLTDEPIGRIRCQQELGGLLKHYTREAALPPQSGRSFTLQRAFVCANSSTLAIIILDGETNCRRLRLRTQSFLPLSQPSNASAILPSLLFHPRDLLLARHFGAARGRARSTPFLATFWTSWDLCRKTCQAIATLPADFEAPLLHDRKDTWHEEQL